MISTNKGGYRRGKVPLMMMTTIETDKTLISAFDMATDFVAANRPLTFIFQFALGAYKYTEIGVALAIGSTDRVQVIRTSKWALLKRK